MTPKIMLRIYLILALSACLWLVYSVFFQEHIKHNRIVNDIVSLHVQSAKVDTMFNGKEIYYHYYVGDKIQGNKYFIVIDKELPEPFKSSGRCEIFIRNVKGDLIFSYDTKFKMLSRTWESDYIKLTKYLNL